VGLLLLLFLLVGDNDAIMEAIQEIKAAYTVKELGPVEDYVGFKIQNSIHGGQGFDYPTGLDKKIEEQFWKRH
jgi:hypothetical protein